MPRPGREGGIAFRVAFALQVTVRIAGVRRGTRPVSTTDCTGVDAIESGALCAQRSPIAAALAITRAVSVLFFETACFVLARAKETIAVGLAYLAVGHDAIDALSFAVVSGAVILVAARL